MDGNNASVSTLQASKSQKSFEAMSITPRPSHNSGDHSSRPSKRFLRRGTSNLHPGSEDPYDRNVDEEFQDERRKSNTRTKIVENAKHRQLRKIHAAALNPLQMMASQVVIPEYVQRLSFHDSVMNLIKSNGFCIVIYLCIVLFSVIMGIQLQDASKDNKDFWFGLDFLFAMIFVFEGMLKFIAFGHQYFMFKSFVMEFCCTLAALMDLMMRYQGLADTYKNTSNLLRCSRIILLSKLFMMKEEFRVLILSFNKSVLSLSGVFFLLVIMCYGSTLVVFSVVGKAKEDYTKKLGSNFDHDKHYGTIGRTMLTLFNLFIMSDWEQLVRPVFQVQPWFVLFFVAFTVFLSFGIMNVVTGIIVDTVSQVHKGAIEFHQDRERETYRKKLEAITDVYLSTFASEDGLDRLITEQEFHEIADIITIVDGIDLPFNFTLEELYVLLDTTGHKKISKQQLIDGFLKLIFSSQFQRDCQAQLSLNNIRRDIVTLRDEIRHLYHFTKTRVHDTVKGVAEGMSMGVGGGMPLMPFPQLPKVLQSSPDDHMSDSPLAASGSSFSPPHRHVHLPQGRGSAPVREKPKPRLSPWGQLRASLHEAASTLCKEELRGCWEALETSYNKTEPSIRPKPGVMPSMTKRGEVFAAHEEKFFVWNKLSSAVVRENVIDLRQALEHAKCIHIPEDQLAILHTYRDALARYHSKVASTDVVQALERNDFKQALEILVDTSLSRGADKSLLLNAVVRLHTEASTGPLAQHQQGQLTNGSSVGVSNFSNGASHKDFDTDNGVSRSRNVMKAVFAPGAVMPIESEVKHLLAVLKTEATQHASKEATKAWEELDKVYKENPGLKGGFGPDYTPFSRQEEQFFIRNQINNAVHQESLTDLRRAVAHAVTFGIESGSMEIEIAYRDALARYHQSRGLSLPEVKRALDTGDWWTALDIVVSASMITGSDRHYLLRLLSMVCKT